jgi:hypothetical protein
MQSIDNVSVSMPVSPFPTHHLCEQRLTTQNLTIGLMLSTTISEQCRGLHVDMLQLFSTSALGSSGRPKRTPHLLMQHCFLLAVLLLLSRWTMQMLLLLLLCKVEHVQVEKVPGRLLMIRMVRHGSVRLKRLPCNLDHPFLALCIPV